MISKKLFILVSLFIFCPIIFSQVDQNKLDNSNIKLDLNYNNQGQVNQLNKNINLQDQASQVSSNNNQQTLQDKSQVLQETDSSKKQDLQNSQDLSRQDINSQNIDSKQINSQAAQANIEPNNKPNTQVSQANNNLDTKSDIINQTGSNNIQEVNQISKQEVINNKLDDQNLSSKPVSKGAKIEAIFFLKNKRNFLQDYKKNYVPVIIKFTSQKSSTKLESDPNLELDNYLNFINSQIKRLELNQENILTGDINNIREKLVLLKALLDKQNEIISLLNEGHARSKIYKKYELQLNEKKNNLEKYKSKLLNDKEHNPGAKKIYKDLEQAVLDLEKFITECKTFEEQNIAKLNKLKQEREKLFKEASNKWDIAPDKFITWWDKLLKSL